MSANIALQVKRGVKANIPTLLAGEFYWATDTLELFVGSAPTPINAFTGLIGAATNKQLPNGLSNANSAQQSQVTVAGTAYYVTSSNLSLPAALVNGIVVGTALRWRLVLNKTAAGTGAFDIILFAGTTGTSSDTKEVTQSIGTQTAVVDTVFIDIDIVFTAVGASGSFYWSICPKQCAATATGFGVATGAAGVFSGTVSGFNTTTASLILGIGFESVTGTPTVTVPIVQAQAFNLD